MVRSLLSCGVVLLLSAAAVNAQGTGNEKPPLSRNTYNRFGPQPWYGQAGVRQQLKLTDEQYNRLNQTYTNAYSGYNSAVSPADGLTEAQRQERMRQGTTTFYKNLDTSYQGVLTPEQQQRYSQLWSQYRGYDALLDANNAQKLKLTDAQIQSLRKYDQEYHQQMSRYNSQYGTNRDDAIQGYNTLQPRVAEQVNSVLTPEQRRQWTEMTGAPYRFEPFYGHTNPK